jgi:O-antigen/teichoic acid export membrane protein
MHLLARPAARDDDEGIRRIYVNGSLLAGVAGLAGIALVATYANVFDRLHYVPVQLWGSTVFRVVLFMGLGVVLRLASEASAAVIQMRNRVTRDNLLALTAELSWPLLSVASARVFERELSMNARWLEAAALGFAASGALLLVMRVLEAARHTRWRPFRARETLEAATVVRLLTLGSMVAVGQLADFLYAPIDYVLINRFISPGTVAHYAPAVQLDAGLLLIAAGLSAVLLPKAAMAHGSGDVGALRRYYVVGTLFSAALLLVAAAGVYLLSGWILYLWLGDPLPQTRAILPLVLVNTVVGGSAGVGRSVLLGMGKIKPFAAAALVSGLLNVGVSYVFVKVLGLGLHGIVYGTLVAVVARCVLWQPWYVLRTLRREAGKAAERSAAAVMPPAPPEPL